MHGKRGGMRGEGVCIGGACVVRGVCLVGAGRAWQERRPLQRTVRISTGMHSCIIDINLPVRTSNHNFNLSD